MPGTSRAWIFGATAIVVLGALVATDVGLLPRRERLTERLLFFWGGAGVLFTGILGFSCQLIMAFRRAMTASPSDASEEERERRLEEIMVPALRGEEEPPAWLSRVLVLPGAVCLGVVAGSVLALIAGWALG